MLAWPAVTKSMTVQIALVQSSPNGENIQPGSCLWSEKICLHKVLAQNEGHVLAIPLGTSSGKTSSRLVAQSGWVLQLWVALRKINDKGKGDRMSLTLKNRVLIHTHQNIAIEPLAPILPRHNLRISRDMDARVAMGAVGVGLPEHLAFTQLPSGGCTTLPSYLSARRSSSS